MMIKLKDILAISGESGLFRYLAQGKNAVIVEHLESGKRHSAQASAKINALEDIALFTTGEDMKLGELFYRIKERENGGAAPDYKSSPEIIKEYFGTVVPEYDPDRVYFSDMKKVIQWYNILHSLNLLEEEESSEESDQQSDSSESPVDKPGSKE